MFTWPSSEMSDEYHFLMFYLLIYFQNAGPKGKVGGKNFFAPELGPPHFQFASCAYEFTTSVRL